MRRSGSTSAQSSRRWSSSGAEAGRDRGACPRREPMTKLAPPGNVPSRWLRQGRQGNGRCARCPGMRVLERLQAALAGPRRHRGAHCIHELWMRNEPSPNIEAWLAQLWSVAADSVPDWLPMRYVEWLPRRIRRRCPVPARGARTIEPLPRVARLQRQFGQPLWRLRRRIALQARRAIRPAQGRHPCGGQRPQARARGARRARAAPAGYAEGAGCRRSRRVWRRHCARRGLRVQGGH